MESSPVHGGGRHVLSRQHVTDVPRSPSAQQSLLSRASPRHRAASASAASPRSPFAAGLADGGERPIAALSWTVSSFQTYFPLLSFSAIQHAMLTVVPNFVAGASGTTTQPTHEQVQRTVAALSELSSKRLASLEQRTRIEEKQTERRWKLFYERPPSRSEKQMFFKTNGEAPTPPTATLHFPSPPSMATTPTRPASRAGLVPLFSTPSPAHPVAHGHTRSPSHAAAPSPTNPPARSGPTPQATVSSSFFSADFLAPVPPRNPLAEWFTSTPTPAPCEEAGASSSRPPHSSAMQSPRFNQHAKIRALHLECEGANITTPVVALSPAQEQELRHFLVSIECPFFSSSVRGFAVAHVITSSELNHMARFVLAPKYTAPEQLVPALFSIMQDVIEANEAVVAEPNGDEDPATGPRAYDSWLELERSMRAVSQLGREAYFSLWRSVSSLRSRLAVETGLTLSKAHVAQIVDQAVHENVHAPSHLIAVLEAFARNGPAHARRTFRNVPELILGVRAGLATTVQLRGEIFAPSSIPRNEELARRIHHVLDLYILGRATLAAAIERVQTKHQQDTASASESRPRTPSSPTKGRPIAPPELNTNTPREVFLDLLAALHPTPNASGSVLHAHGSLDPMLASDQPSFELTDQSIAAFEARLLAEQRLEAAVRADAAAPTSVLALLGPSIWNGKVLEQKHLAQLLQAMPPGSGGADLLTYVLTRDGFMADDAAEVANPSSDGSSPRLSPFSKFKVLARHVRTRALAVQSEARQLLSFLSPRGDAWRSFFPIPSNGFFGTAPPQLTLADATRLVVSSDCERPADALLHLRNLVAFGRSFGPSPSSADDSQDTLAVLSHSVRVLARAQEARARKDAIDLSWELELLFAHGGALRELFTDRESANVDGATLASWLRSLASISTASGAGAQLAAPPRRQLATLALLLGSFASSGHRFSSVASLEANLLEAARLRAHVERELTRTLYGLASRFSAHEPNQLLRALQDGPAIAQRLYAESFCGQSVLSAIAQLQAKTEGVLSKNAAIAASPSDDIPLCTFQSEDEVLACLQAVARSHASSRPAFAALLPLLEAHLDITSWARREFVASLLPLHATAHAFLHASVAARLTVQDAEQLFDRLYAFIPLDEVAALPATLWELAANLPSTRPTAGGGGSRGLDAFKFNSCEQLCAAILAVRASEARAECTRSADGKPMTEDTPSPKLLTSVEAFLRERSGGLFTLSALAASSSTGSLEISRPLVLQLLGAICRSRREDAPAGVPLPPLLLEEVIARVDAILENGPVGSVDELVYALQTSRYTLPTHAQMYELLAGRAASSRLLDGEAQAALSQSDVWLLLHECGCASRPSELLDLLRELDAAAAAGPSDGAVFDSFADALVPAVRTIVATNRAKRTEQLLVRSAVNKQLADQRRGVNQQAEEERAAAQLSAAIQRAESNLFLQPQSWQDEDDDFDQDEHEAASRAPAQLPASAVRRLLTAAGGATTSEALATALHFLRHLTHDYSSSRASAGAYSCADLAQLECAFRALRWRKEWTIRQLVAAVLENERAHGMEHDWTLLASLFVDTAPGLASLSQLPALRTALPDFTTLASFVDGLRLLHSQASDSLHEPALATLARSLARGGARARLIDSTKFEPAANDLAGLWREGVVSKDVDGNTNEVELQVIEARLDAMLAARPAPYTSLASLLNDFRAAAYEAPHSLTTAVLQLLTQKDCMLWRWNTESRAREFWGVPEPMSKPEVPVLELNYLSLPLSSLISSSGAQILAALERTEGEGSSFDDLTSLEYHLTSLDLLAPPQQGWRAQLLAQGPPADAPPAGANGAKPGPPSALHASFIQASLADARAQHEAEMAAAARAHDATMAAALRAREVELSTAFSAERAALAQQLEQQQADALSAAVTQARDENQLREQDQQRAHEVRLEELRQEYEASQEGALGAEREQHQRDLLEHESVVEQLKAQIEAIKKKATAASRLASAPAPVPAPAPTPAPALAPAVKPEPDSHVSLSASTSTAQVPPALSSAPSLAGASSFGDTEAEQAQPIPPTEDSPLSDLPALPASPPSNERELVHG